MCLKPYGVPRSEKRRKNCRRDSGNWAGHDQKVFQSRTLVAGSVFWVWMNLGNFAGSRMKKTGVSIER
jgi:hypothetical protein